MTDDASHEWVRSRLPARSLGLIPDGAARRIDEHLAGCEACRSLADELRGGEFAGDAAGAHLPASLIAAWDERAPELEGPVRDLVRHHLERCDLCRQELVTLGYEPRLDASEGEAGATTQQAAPDRGRVIRLEPRRPWWNLGLSGRWRLAAVAAAAVLLAVVTIRPWQGQEPGTVATRGNPDREATSPAPPAPAPAPGRTASPAPSQIQSPGAGSRGEEPPMLLALGPDPGDALSVPGATRGAREPKPPPTQPTTTSSPLRATLRPKEPTWPPGSQFNLPMPEDPKTLRDDDWQRVDYAAFDGYKPRLWIVIQDDKADRTADLLRIGTHSLPGITDRVRSAFEATYRFTAGGTMAAESDYMVKAAVIELHPDKAAKSIKAVDGTGSSAMVIPSAGVSGVVAFCRMGVRIVRNETGEVVQDMVVDGTASDAPPGAWIEPPTMDSKRARRVSKAVDACASKIAYFAAAGFFRPLGSKSAAASEPRLRFDENGEGRVLPPRSIALLDRLSRVEVRIISGGRVLQILNTSVGDLFPSGQRQAIVLRRGPGLGPGPHVLEFLVYDSMSIQAREELHFTIE